VFRVILITNSEYFLIQLSPYSDNYIKNLILVFGFDMNGFGCIAINYLVILVFPLYEFMPV